MAFCPNCGAQAPGAFCPNCGTAVGSTGTTPPPPGTAAGGGTYQQASTAQPLSAPGMSENVASALCYFGGVVTGIIFLILAPYNQNKLIRFNAFQSIFLFVGLTALWIVSGIVLHFLFFFVAPILGLGGLILWLYLMYAAFNNNKVKLPIIGELAEKQA